MKFIAFALILGLCLVAVMAKTSISNTVDLEVAEEYDYLGEDLAEEVEEIESRSIFSGMYFILKKVLRTINGLNCSTKQVFAMHDASNDFINKVKACGSDVSRKTKLLINSCEKVVETSKDILNINEKICGNSFVEQDSLSTKWNIVAGAKKGQLCFVKVLRKIYILNKQVKRTIELIQKIPNVPADTSQCIRDAIDSLETSFTSFPSVMQYCS